MNPEQKGKVKIKVDLLDLIIAPFCGINPRDIIREEKFLTLLEQETDPVKKEQFLTKLTALQNKIATKLGLGD